MGFMKVASVTEVPEGTGTVVEAGGRELALFNVDGEFYCIDNYCPHMEGPLGEGELYGEIVYCPWHSWPINVKTGEVEYDPNTCTATFPCKLEGDSVLVDV